MTYYNKFIPNLAINFAPLYELLRRYKKWEWTSDCDKAVQEVKDFLTSDNVLVHYDTQKPLVLATDASPTGVGAVLSHIVDGGERPVAYASRSLTTAERKYPQIEKEALGIIFGVRHFYKYIYGRRFNLMTDHQPLTTIFGPHRDVPTLAALRLERWALILTAYDYEISYKKI